MNTPQLPGGAALFQAILNDACDKLEQKYAGLMLRRLARLDSLLSVIETRLSGRSGAGGGRSAAYS
ncbi:MAG: hypothetical protein LBO04_08300 [Spirochaetaceae bacterium]|jgi:hypothetical protein|nr:hypothetical protein [Spirochaetaceae bacterium]